MTAAYIADQWPRLFHMAEAGSWPSIKRHGLLSTSALLDLFEIAGPDREAIESARRPDSVTLVHHNHGTAWTRDNKPINATILRRTLVGMSEPEWYRTLNRRVFLWLSETRLDRLAPTTLAPLRLSFTTDVPGATATEPPDEAAPWQEASAEPPASSAHEYDASMMLPGG